MLRSKKRRQKRSSDNRDTEKRLALESLEDRRLMAVDITLANGLLHIEGDGEHDVVKVLKTEPLQMGRGGMQKLPMIQVWHGHKEGGQTVFDGSSNFLSFSVNEILFNGNDGNDLFDNQTWIKSEAHGGFGVDMLKGGSNHDKLFGEGDADYLYGNAGNDYLVGGGGFDRIHGGAGNDTLRGSGDWNGTFYNDNMNDYLIGGTGFDKVVDEVLENAELTNSYLKLASFNENVVEYNMLNSIESVKLTGNGNDNTIDASEYSDGTLVVRGGKGDDTLIGSKGSDLLSGGDGDDVLQGNEGRDILLGGNGDDTLHGNAGNDLIFGQNGNDHLYSGSGMDRMFGGNGDDTLVSIDADANDVLRGGAGNDSFWVDQQNVMFGTLSDNIQDASIAENATNVHQVASFTNGADKTLDGDNIVDPTDGTNYANFANLPLFASTGPSSQDISQGAVGDCWLMAALGAAAKSNPNSIIQTVVNLGDGTFAVELGGFYYRVDADLPTINPFSNTLQFAGLGQQNSLWVSIVEKAYAFHRFGLNTYQSLNSGWPSTAFGQLGALNAAQVTFNNGTAALNYIQNELNQGKGVAVCVLNPPAGVPLVGTHCYIVEQVNYSMVDLGFGNTFLMPVSVTLRNPWGFDGGGNVDGNPNDGLVTVTGAQLVNSLYQNNLGIHSANLI